jgi:hypothetical protein
MCVPTWHSAVPFRERDQIAMTPFASGGVRGVMRTSSFAALALVLLIVAALAFVLTPHQPGSISSGTSIPFWSSQR